MIYFVNFGMPEKKSGIEHAELKRLALFKKKNIEAKIVTRDWFRDLHRTANNSGVSDDQMINMFDYFQGRVDAESKIVKVDDLDFGLADLQYNDEEENNRYIVTRKNGVMVARVNYEFNDKRVVSVELFDGYNNLYRVDIFDSRGFKTLEQWYSPDNKIINEVWVDEKGRPAIAAYYRKDGQGKLQKSGWKLIALDGSERQFDTIEEILHYFLECLNEVKDNQEYKNIFVIDRALLGDWGFVHMPKDAYMVAYMHNAQTSDAQNPNDILLNNNYEFLLNNLDKYDAVVSATQKQTKDIKDRFKPTAKSFTIPVGIVKEDSLTSPRVPMNDREFGKVIAVARIAWEKHLDDLVRAVAIAKKEVPQITLDLYGYADTSDNYKAKRAVEKVIKDNQLENVVTFKGYTTNIEEIEKNAQVFGLTSRMEGFNLAVMEAISNGMVGVTYDVNYGPNEIIQNENNGFIVPFDDYQAMGQKLIKLFKDPELLQQYSDNAYDSAERYSEENVWNSWQELINDAKLK